MPLVDLNGHEAGNGGYSQGMPTAPRTLLYSERWGCFAKLTRNWVGPFTRVNLNRLRELLPQLL
jgi:hypothetical protein